MGHWEEIEHTADLAVHIWAGDLADLFATAARAMFSLITDIESIALSETTMLTLEALDVETLLVDWLNELLFLDEVRDIAYVKYTFDEITSTRLQATLCGGMIEERLNYVKAATFHNLAVRQADGGYETEIVLDT